MCGALFIVFGIVGAGLLGIYVDKTKKFVEATKVNMSFSALSCIAFSVVRTPVFMNLHWFPTMQKRSTANKRNVSVDPQNYRNFPSVPGCCRSLSI